MFRLLPEAVLALAAIGTLLAPIFRPRKDLLIAGIGAATGVLAAFVAVFLVRAACVQTPGTLFGGLLVEDSFGWALRMLLLLFSGIVLALWFTDSHDKFLARGQAGDSPEFFLLLLIAILGMSLMVQTTNLLIIFIAVELASLPSYVLAGFRKTHRLGAEAALKYVLFGAAAAAVMAYGMSLLYGLYGTLDLRDITHAALAAPATPAANHARSLIGALALAALLVGVGFKIAMVPLHFWCPDVFEGAPIDIATFLAVASKTAGLGLLMRIVMALGPRIEWLGPAVLALGALTCFWGNLAAFPQRNIKRLLAWSSVAHAGYMLMAMSVLLHNQTGSLQWSAAAEALLFYLALYLFMNGGAFVAAAAIAQRLSGPTAAGMSIGVRAMVPPPTAGPSNTLHATGEDLADYAGLAKRAPVLAACMLVCLLSLTGIPLTIGFAAKLKVFTVLLNAGTLGGWLGVAALAINTVLAAF